VKWQVEWGDKVATLQKMTARGETPKALQSRPTPTLHASTYLYAFHHLSTSRSVFTEGLGAIPVSEVLAYAELMGFDRIEDREDLLYYVQICDVAYIEAMRKKQPKDGPGKHSTRRGRFSTGR